MQRKGIRQALVRRLGIAGHEFLGELPASRIRLRLARPGNRDRRRADHALGGARLVPVLRQRGVAVEVGHEARGRAAGGGAEHAAPLTVGHPDTAAAALGGLGIGQIRARQALGGEMVLLGLRRTRDRRPDELCRAAYRDVKAPVPGGDPALADGALIRMLDLLAAGVETRRLNDGAKADRRNAQRKIEARTRLLARIAALVLQGFDEQLPAHVKDHRVPGHLRPAQRRIAAAGDRQPIARRDLRVIPQRRDRVGSWRYR